MKEYTLLITLSILCLCACQTKTEKTTDSYNTSLVESKKITLPIENKKEFLSRSIFQFEEDGKEFLSFGVFERRRQYEIILFDLEKEDVHKRIPLVYDGPDGLPAIRGVKSLNGSQSFLTFRHNCFRFSIIDGEGKLLKDFSTEARDNMFICCNDGISYCYTPSFVIDSVLYFSATTQYREGGVKRHHWKEFPLFTSLDLRNGEIDWYMHYPSIFDHDVKNPAGGYEFTYDYNYQQNRLVCSFRGYGSCQ